MLHWSFLCFQKETGRLPYRIVCLGCDTRAQSANFRFLIGASATCRCAALFAAKIGCRQAAQPGAKTPLTRACWRRLLRRAAALALRAQGEDLLFDDSNAPQLSSSLVAELCPADSILELLGTAATDPAVPAFLDRSSITSVSVHVDDRVESVLADKLLAKSAVTCLWCEGQFMPHHLPPYLTWLTFRAGGDRGSEASDHVHMLMHRVGDLASLSVLRLHELACTLDLPSSLAGCLPPGLTSVELDLQPTKRQTTGSLELGAFSQVPTVDVVVQLPGSLKPDAACLQRWLVPGLQSLSRSHTLELVLPLACGAALGNGLASFSCNSCFLRFTCPLSGEQDTQPLILSALPRCKQLSLRSGCPLQLAWAVLLACRVIHIKGKPRSHPVVTVLGYTGQLPTEPWVVVLDDRALVRGLPVDGFKQEHVGKRTYWVWRTRAGADLNLSPAFLTRP